MSRVARKHRTPEFRALPSEVKGLEEKRTLLIEEMGDMVNKAEAETRTLSEDETNRFDEIKQEIKDLAHDYNMDEKVVRRSLSDDMLKHDIAIRKAIDLVADKAKQVAKKATKKSTAKKSTKEDEKKADK
jgi:FKBP-type peptidyl-prolyl cis-trans isomerase (trigger factor)